VQCTSCQIFIVGVKYNTRRLLASSVTLDTKIVAQTAQIAAGVNSSLYNETAIQKISQVIGTQVTLVSAPQIVMVIVASTPAPAPAEDSTTLIIIASVVAGVVVVAIVIVVVVVLLRKGGKKPKEEPAATPAGKAASEYHPAGGTGLLGRRLIPKDEAPTQFVYRMYA
jgi:hypothetical protein